MAKRTKMDKLYENLLRVTEQFMLGRNFIPLTRKELMKKLHLPDEHKVIFIDVLKSLVKKGAAKFSKGRYYPIEPSVDIVPGVIRLHPRGFGFLQPEDPSLYQQDIFIPKHLTQNAVDGDRVEVQVNPFAISNKGPEGRVIAILQRGRTHLAGIVRAIEWQGDTIAYAPLLGMEQRIIIQPDTQEPLHVGDRIIMKVIDWGSKNTETICDVSHYLGHISDPSCDYTAAIEEYELRADFPTAVINEAKEFGSKLSPKGFHDREDLRKLECFTIDPDTAKDFDDALSLSEDSKGNFHLGVHIADVSHFVQLGSAIDEEAKARCNSTYFPGYCLPMLPSVLSENLCSLRPNVNRLTVSILMDFDSEGNLIDYRIVRAVIRSRKRFTYREAKQVLDGKKKTPHEKTLKNLVRLCHLLKRKRYERGSIEFAIPDIAVIVDKNGAPVKTEYIAYDITHQLVEEFMLKANELVALHLSKNGKELPYRVHEGPSEESMKEFVMLTQAFGFELPDNHTSQDLQALFDEALKTPYGHFLAINYIRRMRLALYSPENIGHYGLGLTHYCHFTSPIRRYIDLVIHRIIFGDSVAQEYLDGIAQHCSEQERISERAENSVTLLKKLRLLDQVTKDDPYKQFEAIVTRVRNFGVYFEVFDFMLEGFLHLSELEDDFYKYDNAKTLLRGIYTGSTFFAGDKITIMLKDIDFILLGTKWNLVREKKKGGKTARKGKRKRKTP